MEQVSDAARSQTDAAAGQSETAIFISYARDDDEPFVERLRDDLVAHGHPVWWDRASMESRGQTFLAEIRRAIETAQRLVLVVGPKAKHRPYVEVEWRHALRHGVVITPLLRMGEYRDLPGALAALHAEDVREHIPEAEALANVRRLVETPVLGQGPLLGVPRIPSPFIARPDLMDRLLSRVLIDTYQPIDLEADQRITSVTGMGGVGKTVLAAAAAHTPEVRRSFQGGIVWTAVGKNIDALRTLTRIGMAIGDQVERYTGVQEARILLSRALENASCLLVLDDVWDAEIVEGLHMAAGERVRILMTSRHQRLFASTGVHTVVVDELADRQALELIAAWTSTLLDDLPPEAKEIIAECGNLPLALSMIGALIRGRSDRWGYALDRLRSADQSRVAARIPDYPYQDLDRAMLVSFEDLDQAIQTRYLDLAAIPEDRSAPGRMLQHWWVAEGMDSQDAVDTLDHLAERSLVRVDDDGRYTVHDVQRDFLLARVGDIVALHQRWVTAFRPAGTEGWHTVEDDGYLLDHLEYHLRLAGLEPEWRELLLAFEWLHRKATSRGFPAVLQDLAAEAEDHHIGMVERACRRAAHILTNDPSQFAAQLLARLDPVEGGPVVGDLLHSARSRRESEWLCPINISLSSVGDPLQVVFRGREIDGHAGTPRSIALSPDGTLIASGGGSSNDTVKLWSVGAATLLRTFEDMMEPGVAALAFVSSDGRVAVAAGDRITVLAAQPDQPLVQTVFHGRAVSTVCGSLGEGIVIVGFREGGVVRWNSTDDSTIVLREPDGDGVVALAHAESAARFVVATSSRIECRRSDDGALVDRIERVENAGVGFKSFQAELLVVNPDGSHVWFGDPACTWMIGAPTTAPLLEGEGRVVAITPDGETALVTSVDHSYDYEELIVVKAATGLRTGRIRNSRQISCLALARDGRMAVTADFEHDVKVWDLDQAPMELADWERRGRVSQVFICDGGALAIVNSVNAAEVWDTATGLVLGAPDAVDRHQLVRHGVSLIDPVEGPDLRERMAAILYSKRSAQKSRGRAPSLADAIGIGPLAWTPTGGRAVTAPPLPGKGPDMEESIASDESRGPGRIWIWDLHDLRAVRQVNGSAGWVTCISITSDGRYAVSGSQGRLLRLWDLDTGNCVRTLRGHRGIVFGCAVTDDARYAVSGSEDMTVRLWDLQAGTLLFTFATGSAVHSCDIASNGSVAIAGEASGRVHLFAVRGLYGPRPDQ
jgi:WD40 repeat protein